MSARQFLDTNILLYGYDLTAGIKRERALVILEKAWRNPRSTAISVQVLQEFHVNFVRSGHTFEEAAVLINDLCQFQVIENTVELFGSGLEFQLRWQLSLWDSMILAAAHRCGSGLLLSEDFNHGQNYGGVSAMNPFLGA